MRIHAAVDNDIHPPRSGGTQRSFGLLRGLARRHEVDAVCVVPYRNAAARDATAGGVRLRRRRAWYTAAAWRLETLGLAPLQLASAGHRAYADRWLGEWAESPDVLCAGPWFGGLLEKSRAPLRVYLSQNVEADHFRMTAPRILARGAWASYVRRLEARIVARADRVVVCAAEDAERMSALHGVEAARLLVAPNGYDETALRAPLAAERERARAALGIAEREHAGIFLGSDAPPNRAALAWLTERVMPRLGREGFRLIVVGGVTRALGGRREPWLIAVPPVDDPLPLLHAADAGLNPVDSGGGSNVKVPAYLAAGLAVVTTEFGLRGYRPLAPLAQVAPLAGFAAAWAERPAGWARGSDAPPAALAAYAWGEVGERLGEAFALALPAAAAAAARVAAGGAGPLRAVRHAAFAAAGGRA